MLSRLGQADCWGTVCGVWHATYHVIMYYMTMQHVPSRPSPANSTAQWSQHPIRQCALGLQQ